MNIVDLKYNKSSNGFTYVEAILTVILTLFISTSIVYAVIRAQNIEQSLLVKLRQLLAKQFASFWDAKERPDLMRQRLNDDNKTIFVPIFFHFIIKW